MRQLSKRFRRAALSWLQILAWAVVISLIEHEYGVLASMPPLGERLSEGNMMLGAAMMMGIFWGFIFTELRGWLVGGSISWHDNELAQLRAIATNGWIVMPSERGGYDAHGPNGETEWHDHWNDVTERFL